MKTQDKKITQFQKEYAKDKEVYDQLPESTQKLLHSVSPELFTPFLREFGKTISKTKAYYQDNTTGINRKILPAGFKDADEEIARLQEKHQQELESAVRRAKLETSAFHEKHLKEIIAKRDGQLFNCKQKTISEVFAEIDKCFCKRGRKMQTDFGFDFSKYQNIKKKFGVKK